MEALDREFKERKAKIREKLVVLRTGLLRRHKRMGCHCQTSCGTAYWSTHHSATVASREDFFSFCKDQDAWDLLEARASKTAVKGYIEASGEPPPGVNYSAVSVFNFRKAN